MTLRKKRNERKVHRAKIAPDWFKYVKLGLKKFEIRRNDRSYQVGDIVILEEYDMKLKEYTGESIIVEIIFICDYEQKHNNIVFGFEKLYHCTGLSVV